MNVRAVVAIARKDIAVVRNTRAVMLPIVIVPTVMLVLLPMLAAFTPSFVNLPGMSDVQDMLTRMPASVLDGLAGYTESQRVVVLMTSYLFAPLYLIVPLMVASVIAADSFAGEKERRTLEGLLHAPITDFELIAAKVLSAFVPAVGVAWLGFALYAVVVNAASWPVMGQLFFPNALWWVLAAWVAPAVAAVGLSATVLVSARVRTFQEAYQLAALVVLPLVVLMVSQATGAIYFGTSMAFLLGVGVWAVAAALLAYGVRSFRRGEIVARM